MRKTRNLTAIQLKTRSGAVVLELILSMPAFLIIMLATVQISLIYVVIQQTVHASRYGARLASVVDQGDIPTLNNGTLKTRVDRVLNAGGIPQGSCRVVLENNFVAPVLDNDPTVAVAGCDCDPPATPLPTVAGAFANKSVRVTVCVALDGNIPDFLDSFGFSIEDYVIEESTTFIFKVN